MSDIGMILDRIGHKLVSDIVPKLGADYAAGHAGMTGYMAVMAGEAWDGAADRLVTEIAGLRHLLQAGQVDHSGVPGAGSFKIGDLTVERDGLAAKLITLQTALEAASDGESRALNAQIWQHLTATAYARMPSPPALPETA